jgi:hypothetical protein
MIVPNGPIIVYILHPYVLKGAIGAIAQSRLNTGLLSVVLRIDVAHKTLIGNFLV